MSPQLLQVQDLGYRGIDNSSIPSRTSAAVANDRYMSSPTSKGRVSCRAPSGCLSLVISDFQRRAPTWSAQLLYSCADSDQLVSLVEFSGPLLWIVFLQLRHSPRIEESWQFPASPTLMRGARFPGICARSHSILRSAAARF